MSAGGLSGHSNFSHQNRSRSADYNTKAKGSGMRPQSCKSKGRRFQQKIARTILDSFEHLTEDDVHSTSMGAPGEDIKLSAAARRCLPLSLECKCVERLNVWQCLEQSQSNCPDGATPCLVFSRNRSPAYAVLPWETLLDLFQRIHGNHTAESLPPRLIELIQEIGKYAEIT